MKSIVTIPGLPFGSLLPINKALEITGSLGVLIDNYCILLCMFASWPPIHLQGLLFGHLGWACAECLGKTRSSLILLEILWVVVFASSVLPSFGGLEPQCLKMLEMWLETASWIGRGRCPSEKDQLVQPAITAKGGAADRRKGNHFGEIAFVESFQTHHLIPFLKGIQDGFCVPNSMNLTLSDARDSSSTGTQQVTDRQNNKINVPCIKANESLTTKV